MHYKCLIALYKAPNLYWLVYLLGFEYLDWNHVQDLLSESRYLEIIILKDINVKTLFSE